MNETTSTWLDSLSKTGDFTGGVIGTLIAGVVLFYVIRTFILQKKQLESQEKELKATRDHIIKQQFEAMFFNMLERLTELKMRLEIGEADFFLDFITEYKINFIQTSDVQRPIITQENGNIILLLESKYNLPLHQIDEKEPTVNNFNPGYLSRFNSWRLKGTNNEQEYAGLLYEAFFNRSRFVQLGHLFRFIRQTVNFIVNERTEHGDVSKYLQLLQAQLSTTQLAILFYDTVSPISYDESDNFMYKDILDSNNFFANVPEAFLSSPFHKQFYPKTKFNKIYSNEKWTKQKEYGGPIRFADN